jgi:GNAT superfamily N-acetyltransferase
MDKISIRRAALNDLETLLEFEQGIAAFERPFDPTLKDGEIHYYDLAQLISAPDAEVLVAHIGSELIGSGYAKILDAKDYLKHRQYAHLGFMYVRPQHRGKGVNQMILQALKQWCLENKITEMRLEVYNDNKQAIKAYAKAGFTPNLLEMRIDLNNPPKP